MFFSMFHAKTYKKYQLGRSTIYDLYSEFCPTTWRNNYVFRRQPQPTASHPQRRGVTALHWAAENGEATVVEQLISAKATVDATNDDGRGPGFSGRFGSGSGEMTEGVRTLAGDFLCFGIFWDAP